MAPEPRGGVSELQLGLDGYDNLFLGWMSGTPADNVLAVLRRDAAGGWGEQLTLGEGRIRTGRLRIARNGNAVLAWTDADRETPIARHGCEAGTCTLQCSGQQIDCGGSCTDPLTDEQHCGASGSCTGGDAGVKCGSGYECIAGACRAPDGTMCFAPADCKSGKCTTFYKDDDGDGYGAAASGSIQVCGNKAPSGYDSRSNDCCDTGGSLAASIHPGQTEFFETAAGICGITFDYDCDGNSTPELPLGHDCSVYNENDCLGSGVVFIGTSNPVCGDTIGFSACGWFSSRDSCEPVRSGGGPVTCK